MYYFYPVRHAEFRKIKERAGSCCRRIYDNTEVSRVLVRKCILFSDVASGGGIKSTGLRESFDPQDVFFVLTSSMHESRLYILLENK